MTVYFHFPLALYEFELSTQQLETEYMDRMYFLVWHIKYDNMLPVPMNFHLLFK